MNLKNLLHDILTNPDNVSFSKKSVGGFICLITTIVFGAINNYEAMTIMAGLTATFFGLTSWDNKVGKTCGDTDGKNP